MLYYLFTTWLSGWGFSRIFRYPSFRIPAAALTALVFTLWLFPWFIGRLKQHQQGLTKVREDVPAQHQKKNGTPTMGGLFILMVVLGCGLLWADLSNVYVWGVMGVLFGFGAIGLTDDWLKISRRDSRGMPGKRKLLLQLFIVIGLSGLGHFAPAIDTHVSVPFVPVHWFNPDLGWFYLPLAYFIVLGTSHAVNLTDGLDGLAIGPTIVSSMVFLVLSYVAGLVLTFRSNGVWVDFNVADYLNLPHIVGTSELAVLCAAMAGAGIGFLWYNTHPATVFMGDVGSLALGGGLGCIAVLTKNELLSALIHGVFLMEAISVITQVISFQYFGRRIFRMAPIHHHFELKGWAEPKIIVRFWILSIVFALLSLVTLKIR
jgi:phospho-N-acetylmuramoyl-pentapeptide-transferase